MDQCFVVEKDRPHIPPFRDTDILLLASLGGGRHIEGSAGLMVTCGGHLYISQIEGVGHPEKMGFQTRGGIKPLRRIQIELRSITIAILWLALWLDCQCPQPLCPRRDKANDSVQRTTEG